MGKHAYLIMAHNHFQLLKKLMSCLDHERCDIYLHIDKKSKYNKNDIISACTKSNVFFTKNVMVRWGGYSQIEAEMLLLEAATQNNSYDYYHLLTGCDLPLRNQKDILDHFDTCSGMNFISIEECHFMDRIKYYYPFQDFFNKDSIWSKIIRHTGLCIQHFFHIDRTNNLNMRWGIGSAYFDISDDFARYICNSREKIHYLFKCSFCADEIFLQTMYLNSPFNTENNLFHSQIPKHEYIQKVYLDVLRAIDWTRGTPYTYQDSDFAMLMESGCLFARKFDILQNPELVEKIVDMVRNIDLLD